MKYSPPAKHIITCMTNAMVIMPVGKVQNELVHVMNRQVTFLMERLLAVSFPLARSSHTARTTAA